MSFQGWKRGQNPHSVPVKHTPRPPIPKQQFKPSGDTILPPPEGLPANYEGFDDSSLFRKKSQTKPRTYFGTQEENAQQNEDILFGWNTAWKQYQHTTAAKWLIALFPLVGVGSILPHFYVPFIAHLFLRSWLIVLIMVLAYAIFETSYLVLLRYSRLHPTLNMEDNRVESKNIKDASGTETVTNDKGPWSFFETLMITTALVNPIVGSIGVFCSWYFIRAFDLPPIDTHLSSSPGVDGLLIAEFIIFYFIVAKWGRNMAWLFMTFGVPIYILALVVPVNRGYSHGFNTFSPYLYWLLINIYLSIWFLRDPFGVLRIREKYRRQFLYQQQQRQMALQTQYAGFQPLDVPLYPTPFGDKAMVHPMDPRKNNFSWWSLDGTYMWYVVLFYW